MEESKEEYYSLADMAKNLKGFFAYLFKRRWLLLLICLIGAGLGAGYFFMQKSKYEAVSTFVLEDKSSGGGGLAGLASQFGFNIGSLTGGGSLFSGDNILDILKSKKIIRQVLLSKIDDSTNHQSLADLYIEFSDLKKNWQKKAYLSQINFITNERSLNPLQDSVLNDICDRIIKKNLSVDRLNKKGSIIKVQVTAANEVFARLMTEGLVNEASRLYKDIRTGTSLENIKQLQRRSDSLLVLLNTKSYTAASTQPLDMNPAVRTAAVPTEIAMRDKTVLATLYAEVTKNLEVSKLLLSQQTPVIQMLDRPGHLLEDHKKGIVLLMILSAFLSAFAYTLIAFVLYMLVLSKHQKTN